MPIKNKTILLLSLTSLLMLGNAYADLGSWWGDNSPRYSGPWSLLFYYSKMTNDHLLDIFSSNNLNTSFTHGNLYSGELDYELAPTNFFRQFIQPIVSTVQIAGNLTYETDPNGNLWEFNPMLWLRWNNFPWNKWVVTSLGFAEGVSYATSIPQIEIDPNNPGGAKHLLNYLGFELTLALPKHPQWELVGRVHHRSGVFGLYSGSNTGSTAVGLGIRYHF